MADEDQVNMRKFLAEAEKRLQASRKLGPDVLPPNLVYPPLPAHDPKGEYRCIKAWWDLGESGLLLYMDLSDGLPFNTEIEFRITPLYCSPYSAWVAPEAELPARSDTASTAAEKRTLKLEDAEDYITGWVSSDGDVTLTFAGYPFDKDDKGNPRITLNWFNADEFGTTIREIVKRVTYEASAGNGQIAEDLGVDFENASPYEKKRAEKRATVPAAKEEKKAETDLSGCGCLVVGALIAAAVYFVFFT